MIKYQKITDISLVTVRYDIDILKNRYIKCRYNTDTSISVICRGYFQYIDTPLVGM